MGLGADGTHPLVLVPPSHTRWGTDYRPSLCPTHPARAPRVQPPQTVLKTVGGPRVPHKDWTYAMSGSQHTSNPGTGPRDAWMRNPDGLTAARPVSV